MRCEIQASDTSVLLRGRPDRTPWTLVALPVATLLIVSADYNIDGQGRLTQIVGRYVFGALFLGYTFRALFRTEDIHITAGDLSIRSNILGLRRLRTIPLATIESAWFDPGTHGSTDSLRLKLLDKALTVPVASGITAAQAAEFLVAAWHLGLPVRRSP